MTQNISERVSMMKQPKFNGREVTEAIDAAVKKNPALASERSELFARAREEWKIGVKEAQSLVIELIDRLSKLTGDGDAIARERELIGEDERFIALSPYVEEILNDGSMMWFHAALRSMARRCMRKHAEIMAARHQAFIEKVAAEKQAEIAECQATPNFGLF